MLYLFVLIMFKFTSLNAMVGNMQQFSSSFINLGKYLICALIKSAQMFTNFTLFLKELNYY
jgi:hypothetical protein